jgi:membrane protein YqaA with SNARE-associated domain|tara:strand:- start:6187 stop:6810 length:624 start_codon:yes stop_codon:yes gene_type:complete
MSFQKNKLKLYISFYVAFSLFLFIIGLLFSVRILEYTGFMMIATTFLPLPADPYTLYASAFFTPVFLGFIGGSINTIAVAFEKYYIREIIKKKRFKDISDFFRELKFSKFAKKNMFASLFISGLTFIPYEPFRLVAIVNNYSPIKYYISVFLSRSIRYFLIGLIGLGFLRYGWLNIAVLTAAIVYYLSLIKAYREKKSYKIQPRLKK